jgi:hypothetical protein
MRRPIDAQMPKVVESDGNGPAALIESRVQLYATEEDTRREYERVWSQLGNRSIEDLIKLPLMNDLASLATLDVLIKIAAPAFQTRASRFPSLSRAERSTSASSAATATLRARDMGSLG